jgi:hypothetical protein
MSDFEQWVGVDFDGTLATYDRWRGEDHLGKPVPLMVRRVQEMLRKGITVKIFTARVAEGEGRDPSKSHRLIGDWTEKHIGQRLEVTNIKDWGMIQLFDDRAVQVVPNTGRIVISTKRKDK